MGYLNEDGLARYDGLIKNWVTLKSGTVDGVDPLLNWQKTETAGAVAFYPLPAAPLDPVVNFAFTETGPVSGTKGPDNPSTIAGISSVNATRCGKNLFNFCNYPSTTKNGATLSSDPDGTLTINGTTTTNTQFIFYLSASQQFTIPSGTILSCKNELISGTVTPVSGSFALKPQLVATYTNGSGFYPGGTDFNETQFTADSDVKVTRIVVLVYAGASFTNAKIRVQIEFSPAATSFEPYSGTDYTVNLNGTYYGGSIDLATGTMTVTHFGHIFDGTEPLSLETTTYTDTCRINTSGNGFPAPVTAVTTTNGSAYCTHYPHKYDWQDRLAFAVHSNGVVRFFTPVSIASTAAELQSFFAAQYTAGTPVTITYPIATPTTVQLTPTQIYSLSQPNPYTPRINTVYSDQVSVQVGYPKSPLATSTELTNAIVSLGGNI